MIEVTFGDGLALCVLDGIAEALHRLKAATIGVKVGEAAGLVAGEQGHCAGSFARSLASVISIALITSLRCCEKSMLTPRLYRDDCQ